MPYLNLDRAAATAVAALTLGAPDTSGDETLASLRTQLHKMIGNRDDVEPEDLDLWLNEAYEDLATSVDIPEFHVSLSFPTVSGQAMYLLPRQVVYTERASLIDMANYSEGGAPLEKIDLPRYRRLPDLAGSVDKYFFENRLFVIYGTPDAVNTIALDVYIRPQRMTDDTDTPILSNEWFSILKENARARAFNALLEWEAGAQAENNMVSQTRRKIDTRAEERSDIVAAFRPARSWRHLRRNDNVDREEF